MEASDDEEQRDAVPVAAATGWVGGAAATLASVGGSDTRCGVMLGLITEGRGRVCWRPGLSLTQLSHSAQKLWGGQVLISSATCSKSGWTLQSRPMCGLAGGQGEGQPKHLQRRHRLFTDGG